MSLNLVSGGGGISLTEAGYLVGITSSVQTQLDAKLASTASGAVSGKVLLLPASLAKGDLLVYNGSAIIRVAVGANGTVLTADSTAPSGVKWA